MEPILKKVKLSDITFDEIVYPRKAHDPILVQRYVTVLDEIEASQKFISVSSNLKLLDGKHRWLAYRKRNEDPNQEINVLIYPVDTPHEQLKLSAKLNSEHGWQLTEDDKETTAKSLYAYGATYDDIASTLSVGKKKVSEWLARTVKENKSRRDTKIFDMWLACYTNQEIADELKEAKGTIDRLLGNSDDGLLQKVLQNQMKQTMFNHLTDFDPPIYNVWKYKENTPGSNHFGNTNIKILDNLLYLYTQPFDVVIDPFAGGGSTIDLCKKRFRRYWVSDRLPIVEREKDIRKHDIVDGLPPLPRWKDVKLVYLDPPYWKQAQGKYSNDKSDLSNMEIDIFHETLSGLIKSFSKKLQSKSYIALIIQPTQWNAPDKIFTDHIAEMIRTVNLTINMRYLVPYESQQANAQMVEWAKQNRKCLVLSRELMVWEV